MSDLDIAKLIAESEGRLKLALQGSEDRLNTKINAEVNDRKGIVRQRNLAILACAICLVVAIYAVSNARTANEARDDQIETNQIVLCAQGRSTALATRELEDGESRSHFVNRMAARRALLLSLGSLHCAEQKGFATFAFLRGQALADIEEILRRLAPRRFRELVEGERGLVAIEAPMLTTGSTAPSVAQETISEQGQPGGHNTAPKSSNPPSEANPPGHNGGHEPDPQPGPIPAPAPEPTPVSPQPSPPASQHESSVVEVPTPKVCLKPVICVGAP